MVSNSIIIEVLLLINIFKTVKNYVFYLIYKIF